MEKHFILVLNAKPPATPVAAEQVLGQLADGVKIEWMFVQEQRQVCKISAIRAVLKPLHDSLFATGLYNEIKLFEHVEW